MNKKKLDEEIDKIKIIAEEEWIGVMERNPYLQRQPKVFLEPLKEIFTTGYRLGYLKKLK